MSFITKYYHRILQERYLEDDKKTNPSIWQAILYNQIRTNFMTENMRAYQHQNISYHKVLFFEFPCEFVENKELG